MARNKGKKNNSFIYIGLCIVIIITFLSLKSLLPTILQQVNTKHVETASLYVTDLGDPQSKIFYADKKTLYSYSFDGKKPQKITELPEEIFRIKMIPFTNDLHILTIIDSETPGQDHWKDWILSENTSTPKLLYDHDNEELKDELQLFEKRRGLTTRKEFIYPNQKGIGIDIMSDTLDGTNPKKIGNIPKPLLTSPCEGGPCIKSKTHPSGFTPSFTGEYLINAPSGGGGLGEEAIVVSRDGTKVYKIDFYWYVSDAIWISGNELLTSNSKKYTFNTNGTFQSKDISFIEGELSQKSLSPSKKYLVLEDDKELKVVNMEDETTQTINQIDEELLKDRYDIKTDKEILSTELSFLGWNNNSDKVVYGIFISKSFYDYNKEAVWLEKEIKVYNVKTQKSYTIAKLELDNPMWLDMRFFAFY